MPGRVQVWRHSIKYTFLTLLHACWVCRSLHTPLDDHCRHPDNDVLCSVAGHQEQPVVEGEAQIRKASIHCTYLKEPMTNVYADVSLANDQLQVSADIVHCCDTLL